MRQEQFPWIAADVGRPHGGVSSLEELPAEAAVDRESVRRSASSQSDLPLSVGGEPPVGALGLNTLRAHRDWPDALVKRLQLVAEVFTNALARTRHELSLRESEARLAAGADLAGLAFYEVDYHGGVASSTTGFATSAASPRTGRRACRPWSSGWSICTRTTVIECWTCAGQLHAGTVDRLIHRVSFPESGPGGRWFPHIAVRRQRDARDARSSRTVSCATSRRDGARRNSCSRRSRRYSGSATTCQVENVYLARAAPPRDDGHDRIVGGSRKPW